jgi:hypothetical protein
MQSNFLTTPSSSSSSSSSEGGAAVVTLLGNGMIIEEQYIPQDRMRLVIGAKGTTINQLMLRSSCRIAINQYTGATGSGSSSIGDSATSPTHNSFAVLSCTEPSTPRLPETHKTLSAIHKTTEVVFYK